MICEGDFCGTGYGSVVLPGDPDSNMALSASPAYGGVDLTWSLPAVNGYAVSFTEVYRSQMNDFNTAIRLASVGGDFYFDKVNPGTLYYYWVRTISINGTFGVVIGPASAAAKPSIDQTIRDLTGKIDAGLLAQSLKTPIENIIPQGQAILKEITDRIAANDALSTALMQVRTGVEDAMTYIQKETIERKDGDGAVVQQMNLIVAAVRDATALIEQEQQVRAGKDEALAQQIQTVYASITTTAGDVAAGLVQQEASVRAQQDEVISRKVDTTYAQIGNDIAAAVRDVTQARVTSEQAIADRISSVASTLDGDIAQVEQHLQTNVQRIDGKVVQLGSLYTIKLTSNGLAGGFGVYNDGTTVQAGWDVDSFWVGRTTTDMKKPFIIQDGQVFINEAVINTLTFDKLRAADGSLVVENGRIKATYLSVQNAIFYGKAQNADGSNYIDFSATGSMIWMKVGNDIELHADGTGSIGRPIIKAPTIVAQGTRYGSWKAFSDSYDAQGNPVSTPGFTVYIDTGVSVSASWSRAAEDMFLASATIARGTSQSQGAAGYSEVSLVIGDGLVNGTPSVPDNRIYIKYVFMPDIGNTANNGTFTATALEWKLVRV